MENVAHLPRLRRYVVQAIEEQARAEMLAAKWREAGCPEGSMLIEFAHASWKAADDARATIDRLHTTEGITLWLLDE